MKNKWIAWLLIGMLIFALSSCAFLPPKGTTDTSGQGNVNDPDPVDPGNEDIFDPTQDPDQTPDGGEDSSSNGDSEKDPEQIPDGEDSSSNEDRKDPPFETDASGNPWTPWY